MAVLQSFCNQSGFLRFVISAGIVNTFLNFAHGASAQSPAKEAINNEKQCSYFARSATFEVNPISHHLIDFHTLFRNPLVTSLHAEWPAVIAHLTSHLTATVRNRVAASYCWNQRVRKGRFPPLFRAPSTIPDIGFGLFALKNIKKTP